MSNVYEPSECVECGQEAVYPGMLCDECIAEAEDVDILERLDSADDALIDSILARKNYEDSLDIFRGVDY